MKALTTILAIAVTFTVSARTIVVPISAPANVKLGMLVVGVMAADDQAAKPAATNGFVWPASIPGDCPFARSQTFTGVFFTGRDTNPNIRSLRHYENRIYW